MGNHSSKSKNYNQTSEKYTPNFFIPKWTTAFQSIPFDSVAITDLDEAALRAKNEKKFIFLVFDDFKDSFQQSVWPLSLFAEALSSHFVLYVGKPSHSEELKKLSDSDSHPQGALLSYEDDHQTLSLFDNVTNGVEMTQAMIKNWDGEVPYYVQTARREFALPNMSRATFSMGCYWQGEHHLGKVEGVTQLLPGWFGGAEVVEVIYDPEEANYKQFASVAKGKGWSAYVHDSEQKKLAEEVGTRVGSRDPNSPIRMVTEGENKHHIKSDKVLCKLPLTPLQAARANSSTSRDQVERLLSPNQKTLLSRIEKGYSTISKKVRYFPDTLEELPEYEKKLLAALKEAGV